ncbi:MAG: TolC family protein [Saprospiraceae bacterium]|nr:TolC family protein [Saprospiraceae bacterium]
MRIRNLFLILLAASGLTAQTQMTLDQAINYALSNNQEIQLARLNIEDADGQITERRAFGIPQLSADIGYNHYFEVPTTVLPSSFFIDPNTGQPDPNANRAAQFGVKNNLTGTLALNTMLFDPSYFVGLKAARGYRDYTAQELVSRQRKVKYQVIEAFLPTLLVDENLKNLDKNITNLQKLRDETKALYDEGFVELLDVDRLDLSIATIQTERDNLANQRKVILNGLKMVMGYPMDKELDVAGNLQDLLSAPDVQDLTGKVDYMRWPDYRVSMQGKNLAELNVKLAKFGYLPSLYGFANVQRTFQGDNAEEGIWSNASLAGLSLKAPLFDGLLTQGRVQRAKVTEQNTLVQIRMLEQQIDMSVQNARDQYNNAIDKLRNQEKNLNLAERIYETTRIKYREGVGSSLEINQAEQALFTAQRQHVQAQFDVVSAIQSLENALGK